MASVYLNGRRLVPGCLMVYEDEVWTKEDEEAYSDPDNHLPPVDVESEPL